MTIPQYPRPQYPPPRKRRAWPWILLGVVTLAFGGCFATVASIGLTANKAVTSTSTNPFPTPEVINNPATAVAAPPTTIPPLTAQAPTGHGKTVLYEVISDSATLNSVTYFDAKSAEQQETDVTAPWSKTVVNTSTFVIAGIGAQTNGQSVTCRITVDGKITDTKTATGQYAVVNCTAPIG